jgi:Etoposide-induced protein 2.4 (EI24)
MSLFFDAFWRALAYCLHPRVILLSLLPLLITAGLSVALGWFFWEPAVAGVRSALDNWSLVDVFLSWLESAGATGLRIYLAPLIVIALSLPVVVLLALILVALFMTPALVRLVAARRFPLLERRHGAGLWQSAFWSLGCTALALLAIIVSIPLWFIPPLVLIVPPLVWGWLTYRVMSFDVLAEHASKDERSLLLREHRWPLLLVGIICGYLGAAPSLLWALGATWFIPLAPVLVVVAIWLYTLVFAFSALWFAHYTLAALQQLRRGGEPPRVLPATTTEVLPAPPLPPEAGLTALPPH